MQTQIAPPANATAPIGVIGAVSVSSTVDDAPIIVTVPAEVWAARLALKAEIAAREKAVKAIDDKLGLPDPQAVGKPATIIIVNGNGLEMGKGSIFWYGGAIIPPSWRRRVG